MRTLARYVLIGYVVALLAGCLGSQPPIGGPGAMPQSSAIATHAPPGRSWMLPEVKNEDLLYISDLYGVHVFSYPKGVLVGEIYGFASPEGLCSDQAGDVFVTDISERYVDEYAHGGTRRLKTLYDNYVDFNPIDCSVDPTTGNVAVTSADAGFVVIFPKARNKPQVYYEDMSPTLMYRCAYDNSGDLFVDQVYNHGYSHTYIGELPKGATKFKNYLLDRRIFRSGGIQFDGKRVAIEDLRSRVVYQLGFSGTKAIVVGSTPLNGAKSVAQYWIHGKMLIGPDEYGVVYFWEYPGGGSPVNSIQGFTLDVGSAVSLAPR